MDKIDAMAPSRRALIHEYGYQMVRSMLVMLGEDVDDHTLERLLQQERQRRSP